MNTPTTKKPAKKPAIKKPAAKKRPVKRESKEALKAPVVSAEEKKKETSVLTTQNIYAVGKRKTSVAQVIITAGSGNITVNEVPLDKYFAAPDLKHIVFQPMSAIGLESRINVRAKTSGGGIHSQAESVRHAIARALVSMDPEARRTLKKGGFLTRDPRVKERKKPGLKRARRAPQFSKR
jgi:small subunit ribosomal protein S9